MFNSQPAGTTSSPPCVLFCSFLPSNRAQVPKGYRRIQGNSVPENHSIYTTFLPPNSSSHP